ncbi:MAG: hypothetical protein IKR11_01210 [Solobacterium sp.]|nr:hypothetical protein [Solobacterium sp.]
MNKKKKTSVKSNLKPLLSGLLSLSILSGCTNRKYYDDVEKNALEYYKDKYHLQDVTVVRSYKAGNNGLFGYIGVKDRAYEMSDGNSVYWAESLQKYSDNAQSKEITKAFEEQMLNRFLSSFTYPFINTSFSLNRTKYDSFDECVFTAYYDGHIETFLKEERPSLSGLTIVLETDDQESCEKEITRFYDSLREYVSGWNEIYILNEGLDAYTKEDLYIDDKSLNVIAKAYLDYENKIKWYRQSYIEIFDGIFMTSIKKDFVLQEGDITLVERGTCADLQKMLDDSYYGMPVDAEENKKGGYMKKDQRHESRIVIDDPGLPLYQIQMTQRVLDELDERGCLDIFILDQREEGLPLMMYYGTSSTASIYVYTVCKRNEEEASYTSISPEYYYYFGTHQSYPYEEE